MGIVLYTNPISYLPLQMSSKPRCCSSQEKNNESPNWMVPTTSIIMWTDPAPQNFHQRPSGGLICLKALYQAVLFISKRFTQNFCGHLRVQKWGLHLLSNFLNESCTLACPHSVCTYILYEVSKSKVHFNLSQINIWYCKLPYFQNEFILPKQWTPLVKYLPLSQ